MKTIKITGIVIAAILLSNPLLAQTALKEQLIVPLSDPSKPYKLSVSLISGSIKVTAHEGKDIIIDAEAEQKKENNVSVNGMKRINGGGNLDVTATEKSNVVSVHTGIPNKSVTLSIRIPAGASSIKLSTINNGSVVVSNINAELEVSNTNGGIKLENVSGSVVANTINGNVNVLFKSIDPKAAMAFSTLNGNVDVTFPATLKANVKLRSDQGNVYSDFDMVNEPGQSKTTKTAKDGMYRISVEDWIYGKIGLGGPELMMKTMNGNIYLRKAK